jgi:hypothetical protein
MVTREEVAARIRDTEYGEYDCYHDWTPTCSLEDKARVLGALLDRWDATESGGREEILRFLQALIRESGNGAGVVRERVTPFLRIPEVRRIMEKPPTVRKRR